MQYSVSIEKPVIDFDLGMIKIENKLTHNHDTYVEDTIVKCLDMQMIGSSNRNLQMVKVSLKFNCWSWIVIHSSIRTKFSN